MTRLKIIWLLLMLILAVAACTSFPKDPQYSFQDAKSNGLKVGVVVNPPYVTQDGEDFRGIEMDLIKGFAEEKGLRISYVHDSETNLIKQLENYDIHLLAGGFEQTSVWISKVGMTGSYDKNHVLLIPRGENRLLYEIDSYLYEEP